MASAFSDADNELRLGPLFWARFLPTRHLVSSSELYYMYAVRIPSRPCLALHLQSISTVLDWVGGSKFHVEAVDRHHGSQAGDQNTN